MIRHQKLFIYAKIKDLLNGGIILKSYAERQRSFDCKVGDTVKIFKKPTEYESMYWHGGWVSEMNRCIGQIGEIVKIKDSGIFVRISEVPGPLINSSWIWPYTSLEIIR